MIGTPEAWAKRAEPELSIRTKGKTQTSLAARRSANSVLTLPARIKMDIGAGRVGGGDHFGELRHVIRFTLTGDDHRNVGPKTLGRDNEILESLVGAQIAEESKAGASFDP